MKRIYIRTIGLILCLTFIYILILCTFNQPAGVVEKMKNPVQKMGGKLAGWGDKTLTTGFLQSMKNVGFSRFARATEPQSARRQSIIANNH